MSAVKNYGKSYWIKWAVTIALPILAYFLAQGELFSQQVRIYILISLFGILMIAFEFFDNFIPAVFLTGAYAISGIVSASQAWGSWTGTTLWLIIGTMLFTNVMNECGLLRRIALSCIQMCNGSFTGLYFGCIIASWILQWIGFGNCWVITGVLIMGMCVALGFKPNSKEAIALTIAAILSVGETSGAVYNPMYLGFFNPSGQAVMGADYNITWYENILYAIPNMLWLLFSSFIMGKIIGIKKLKAASSIEYINEEKAKLGKMSKAEKKVLVIFTIMVGYVLTSPIHGQVADYAFIFCPLLCFLPFINCATEKSVKELNFSSICFIASCMAIGQVGAAVGFGDVINQGLGPVLIGQSKLLGTIGLFLIGVLANFIMTPLGFISALCLPVAELSFSMGMDPAVGLFAIASAGPAIIFPYETAPTVLIFAFGMCSMKNWVKYMSIKLVIHIIFVACIFYPFYRLIGLTIL